MCVAIVGFAFCRAFLFAWRVEAIFMSQNRYEIVFGA